MRFIGIDPGMKGGVAVIENGVVVSGELIATTAIEFMQQIEPWKNDAVACIEQVCIQHRDLMTGAVFNIEKLIRHQQMCITVLELLEIPVFRIEPMAWKSGLSLAGESDTDCISKALELHPEAVDLVYRPTRGGRKLKAYDGPSDAILIAHWRSIQTDEMLSDRIRESKENAAKRKEEKKAKKAKAKVAKAKTKVAA